MWTNFHDFLAIFKFCQKLVKMKLEIFAVFSLTSFLIFSYKFSSTTLDSSKLSMTIRMSRSLMILVRHWSKAFLSLKSISPCKTKEFSGFLSSSIFGLSSDDIILKDLLIILSPHLKFKITISSIAIFKIFAFLFWISLRKYM